MLYTLGELRLEDTDFQRPKALLLLTYLAIEGKQERRHLAELFWPDLDDALGNLAMTLTRLRKAYPKSLEVNNRYVQTNIETDALKLNEAYNQHNWPKVLELYKSSLLAGIHLKDWSSELEEWVYTNREKFAAKAREALLCLAEQEASKQVFTAASQYAARAYQLRDTPEPEPQDLERLYMLLQASNHTLAKDVSKEASYFGLQLNCDESQAIKHLNSNSQPHHLSSPQVISYATSFIGRELERQTISEQLYKTTCRLLSIVGPGGIGKTRLATAVAIDLSSHFKDGTYFVSLNAIPSPDQMVFSIGDVLKLTFLGQNHPKEQLLHYLGNKHMLLVLDNLEHLLDDVSLVTDILKHTENIKMLITSRERLNLQSEHIFDLYGLNITDQLGDKGQLSDALQLFSERANHAKLDFEIQDHLPEVTRICELVGGMPLAIELAASWIRLLSPVEVLSELETSLDILANTTRDLPSRHQSMKQVFESSWQHLSETEQAALRKLSVFQGGFTKEAARVVATIDLHLLLMLVNKSFLWRKASGRFSQHPLLMEYLRQIASDYPEEKHAMEEKHCLYYLEFAQKYATDTRNSKRINTLKIFDEELVNIQTAWTWAIHNQQLQTIKLSTLPLGLIYENRSVEGLSLIDEAIAYIAELVPTHFDVLGYLYIQRAYFLRMLSRHHNSLLDAKMGLELLDALQEP
jgi:DNA replication protein DnaC